MKRYRIPIAWFAVFLCFAVLSVGAEETVTQPVEEPPRTDSPGFFRTIVSGLFGISPAPEPSELPPEAMFGELPSVPTESVPPENAREKVEIQTDYKVAVREAQLRNRPLLVLLGAEWCTWCRKLEADLEKPEAKSLLSQWIIVKVDVDDEPEIASRLEASALPGLRILDPLEKRVASREGYLELPELKNWLAANRKSADPVLERMLFDTSPPDAAAIEQLVSLLGETSPTTRAAAMERLAAHPSKSARALVETLQSGRLIQQLSAREVLRRLEAPIEDLDPWRPETLSDAKFTAARTWSKERMEIESDSGKAAEQPLDTKVVEELMSRLLRADANQRTSLIAQLVSLGPQIAVEAQGRLTNSEIEDDDARERLRELLYNALAGRSLRIKQPGLLTALAALDADSHRQAAESVLKQATSDDQAIVDELSRDADPLVRELAVQALGRLGILPDGDRIALFLKDSSPNVRTAVLRALAEHPSDKAVQSLCDYLREETNEDLLVHGAKCLAQLAQKPETFETLGVLARNESWRVRAASIEAAGQVLGGNGGSPSAQFRVVNGKVTAASGGSSPLPNSLTQAIIAAAFESDKFVAERALQLLPRLMNESLVGEEALRGIAERLGAHPEQLQLLVGQQGVIHGDPTYAPLIELAKEWLAEENGERSHHAAVLLSQLAPTELNGRLAKLIASENRSIRMAGLRAAIDSASAYRQDSLVAARAAWAASLKEPAIEPWFELPDSKAGVEPTADNSAKNDSPATPPTVVEPPAAEDDISIAADFFGVAPATPSTKPNSVEAPVRVREQPEADVPISDPGFQLGLIKDLFGDTPPPSTTIPSPAPVLKVPSPNQAKPLQGDPALALPSSWMEEWQSDESKNRPTWLAECDAPTEMLLRSDDPQERAWAFALWLVLGHTDRIDELFSALNALREADKTAADDLERVDLLSWLTSERRLSEAKRRIAELDGDGERILELLTQSTWVDDAALADWMFDFVNHPALSDGDLNAPLAQILIRSRTGFSAEELPSVLSASGYQFDAASPFRIKKSLQITRIPGRPEACNWLRGKFLGDATDHQRAIALIALARLDHQTAVNAAIDTIQSADSEGETLETALAIVLFDATKPSAQRAVELLNHTLPAVQLAALHVLASPGNMVHQQEPPSVPIVANEIGVLPGFWAVRESYPVGNLKSRASSEDLRESAQANLLLLAAGEEVDPADLPLALEKFYQNHGSLLVAAALAKAERTDATALKHYEATFAAAADDSIAAGLYTVLRNLQGSEIAQLRRRMREEKGPRLFNNNQDLIAP